MPKWEYLVGIERNGLVPVGIDVSEFYDLVANLTSEPGEEESEEAKTASEKIEQYIEENKLVGLDDFLNVMGEEGWELISIMFHDDLAETKVVFKRPKGEA